MTENEINTIADYFTPCELVELIDIDTYSLVKLLEEEYFSDDVISDLFEIMGVGSN